MEVTDVRQSEGWTEYLSMYNWQQVSLAKGSVLRVKPTILGSIAKLQRPTKLLDSDLAELDNICKERNIAILKLEPNLNQDLQLVQNHNFVKLGWPFLAPKTLTINLTKSQKILWEDLDHNARRSVNRANNAGVTVREVETSELELRGFYELLSKAASSKKYYVQSFEEIKGKSDAFGKESHLLNAYDSTGKLCSSQIYLSYKNNAWSIHGASSEEGKKNNAGYKLLWEACLFFKNKNFDTIDLEGLYDTRYPQFTKGWNGFSSYKQKFGGEVLIFPQTYTKFFSKPYKFASMFGLTI